MDRMGKIHGGFEGFLSALKAYRNLEEKPVSFSVVDRQEFLKKRPYKGNVNFAHKFLFVFDSDGKELYRTPMPRNKTMRTYMEEAKIKNGDLAIIAQVLDINDANLLKKMVCVYKI